MAAVAVTLRLTDQTPFRGINPHFFRAVDVVGDVRHEPVKFLQLTRKINVVEEADFGPGELSDHTRPEERGRLMLGKPGGFPTLRLEFAPAQIRRGVFEAAVGAAVVFGHAAPAVVEENIPGDQRHRAPLFDRFAREFELL